MHICYAQWVNIIKLIVSSQRTEKLILPRDIGGCIVRLAFELRLEKAVGISESKKEKNVQPEHHSRTVVANLRHVCLRSLSLKALKG